MKPPKLLNELHKQAQADIEQKGYDHAMSQLAQKIISKGGRVLEVNLSVCINTKAEFISFTLEDSASSCKDESETPYALTLALLGHLESAQVIAGLRAQLHEVRQALEEFPEEPCAKCSAEFLPFFEKIQKILRRSINEKLEEFHERQTS